MKVARPQFLHSCQGRSMDRIVWVHFRCIGLYTRCQVLYAPRTLEDSSAASEHFFFMKRVDRKSVV